MEARVVKDDAFVLESTRRAGPPARLLDGRQPQQLPLDIDPARGCDLPASPMTELEPTQVTASRGSAESIKQSVPLSPVAACYSTPTNQRPTSVITTSVAHMPSHISVVETGVWFLGSARSMGLIGLFTMPP